VAIRTSTGQRLCLLIILVYAAAWRATSIDRPFEYDDESTGAAYGVFARNYLTFGLAETRALPVMTVGQPPPNTPLTFYRDHPPLVPLLIALTYLPFGFGEWQTRLLSALASVGAVWVLYRLVTREHSARAGLIAAAIYAATPMNLYFGGMPEVLGAPLVFFSLLAVDGYLSLHDRPTTRRLAWLSGAFAAAALCDWPAFFLVPVLLIHFMATRPRRSWGWMLAFGAVAFAVFVAVYVYIALAARLPWNWMVPLFLHRSAIGTSPFTTWQWWSTAVTFNRHLHTAPVLVLSALWLLTDFLPPRFQARWSLSETMWPGGARILIAWGLLHVVVGRQGVFNHEWWWWMLTPGLAVTAALLLDSIVTILEQRWSSTPRAKAIRPHRGYGAPVAAAAIIVFTLWTSVSTYKELFPDRRDERFTTRELGEAIRAAAPQRDDLALLVWTGFDPQIWFYGDRAVRANVWSIADFERRLEQPTADLLFGFEQPWTGPATGLVFPVQFHDALKELRDFLRRRYRLAALAPPLDRKFDVYDLTSND